MEIDKPEFEHFRFCSNSHFHLKASRIRFSAQGLWEASDCPSQHSSCFVQLAPKQVEDGITTHQGACGGAVASGLYLCSTELPLWSAYFRTLSAHISSSCGRKQK